MSKPWSYCPECGSEETQYEEGDHKQCANCHQEWFSDIDYSDVVRKHLSGQHSDKDAVIERLRAELAALKAGRVESMRELLRKVAPHFAAPPGLGHLHAEIDAALQAEQ